jgi:hypothetical protein
MKKSVGKAAILMLLLMVATAFSSVSCPAFNNKEEAVAEVRALYEELLAFKVSKKFIEMGFAPGNQQAHAWMGRVEKLSGELKDTDYSIMLKIAPGDMIQLGLEYLKTKGAENNFTRSRREELEETLY